MQDRRSWQRQVPKLVDHEPSRADYIIGIPDDQFTLRRSSFFLTVLRKAHRLLLSSRHPSSSAPLSTRFTMIWWYWMVLGLALLGAEMTMPGGFYILFFGLSALVVGTLAGLEVVNADWLQWLLFSAIAVGSLLLFRGPLSARLNEGRKGQPDVDSMVDEVAIPIEPLAVGATGKAEMRGTTWTAKNVGSVSLAKGQRGKVTRVEGLTLWIVAE
jgi:membrane protein implicated in regulation of membrane protease activity